MYYSSKPKDEVDYSLCRAKQSNLLFFLSKLLMNGAVVVAATQTCKGSPPRMI